MSATGWDCSPVFPFRDLYPERPYGDQPDIVLWDDEGLIVHLPERLQITVDVLELPHMRVDGDFVTVHDAPQFGGRARCSYHVVERDEINRVWTCERVK